MNYNAFLKDFNYNRCLFYPRLVRDTPQLPGNLSPQLPGNLSPLPQLPGNLSPQYYLALPGAIRLVRGYTAVASRIEQVSIRAAVPARAHLGHAHRHTTDEDTPLWDTLHDYLRADNCAAVAGAYVVVALYVSHCILSGLFFLCLSLSSQRNADPPNSSLCLCRLHFAPSLYILTVCFPGRPYSRM